MTQQKEAGEAVKKKSVSNIQTHTRKKLIRLSHLGELAIKSCWLFLQAYKEM